MKPLILVLAAVMILVGEEVRAAERHFCQPPNITTYFVDGPHVTGCNVGDAMSVQVSSNVGPGAIVAQYCDFRFSIYVEKFKERNPANEQATIVCIYDPKVGRKRTVK
ncbi:MAG: hypothetical protein HOH80_20920 [Rhodospirillaceae bacterium]|jgi:hypothetical protein|nr:hypothetical protein [Rhodospirillaceae bacterium]